MLKTVVRHIHRDPRSKNQWQLLFPKLVTLYQHGRSRSHRPRDQKHVQKDQIVPKLESRQKFALLCCLSIVVVTRNVQQSTKLHQRSILPFINVVTLTLLMDSEHTSHLGCATVRRQGSSLRPVVASGRIPLTWSWTSWAGSETSRRQCGYRHLHGSSPFANPSRGLELSACSVERGHCVLKEVVSDRTIFESLMRLYTWHPGTKGQQMASSRRKYAIMVSIESRKLVGSFPRLPQKSYNMPPVIAAGTMSGAVGFHRHKRRSRRSHRVLSSTCDHEATTPSLFAR